MAIIIDVTKGSPAKRAGLKKGERLIAVNGRVSVKCEYGGHTETYVLDTPEKGLLIDGLVWREMYDFSPDCVLVVLASEYYSEADYIRDHQIFLKEDLYNEKHA